MVQRADRTDCRGPLIEQANADVDRMVPLSFEKFALPPGFSREMLASSGFAGTPFFVDRSSIVKLPT